MIQMAKGRPAGAKGRPAGSKDSKPRKRKTDPGAPGAEGEGGDAGIGHNSNGRTGSRLTPDEERELFLHHRRNWTIYQNKLAVAEEYGTKIKADLKQDGFKVLHMKIADDLGTPKGEQRVVADVTDRLKVARWTGHAMGKNADLFEFAKRTPVTDRAYDEGKMASMQNQPRQPPEQYAPATDAYNTWMQGYNDHQEELASRVGRGEDSNVTPLQRVIAEGDALIREHSAAKAK